MTDEAGGGFALAGAAYLCRIAGPRAHDLESLRAALATVSRDVLFHHTQLPRLEAPDDDAGEDEISAWVRGVVQDAETGERLAFAVQTCRADLEALRVAMLSVLDRVPAGERRRRQAPPGGEFVPLTAEPVIVPTGIVVRAPADLLEALGAADRGTWFHHLVEEVWLPGRAPGLFAWLEENGAGPLRDTLAREAAAGRAIESIRARLLARERRRALRRRMLDLAARPSDDRGEAAREAATRFARRLARGRDES